MLPASRRAPTPRAGPASAVQSRTRADDGRPPWRTMRGARWIMGPGIDGDRDVAQVVEHDPVCGAPIPDEDAAPSVEHGGRRLWFCSEACRNGFLQDPQRFALGEDLAEDIAAERSDGEAGTLRDQEPYLSS